MASGRNVSEEAASLEIVGVNDASENEALEIEPLQLEATRTNELFDFLSQHERRKIEKRLFRRQLWIAVLGILVLLASNLYCSERVFESVQASGSEAQEEGTRLMDSEELATTIRAMGERTTFTMISPFMPQGDMLFDANPLLRSQTVGFVFSRKNRGKEHFHPSGVPKAWLPFSDQYSDEDEAAAVPLDLEWLEEFAIRTAATTEEGEAVPATEFRPFNFKSSDAIFIARKLDARMRGAPHADSYEAPRDSVKRRFARLVNKLGEPGIAAIIEAERLKSTQWDLKSRTLRGQLHIAQTASDLLRLEERRSTVEDRLEKAIEEQKKQKDTEKESLDVEAAKEEIAGILLSQQLLLLSLKEQVLHWGAESSSILTGIASVVSSPSFSDIEELASFLGKSLATAKVAMKMNQLKKGVMKELSSKNICLYTKGAIDARLEEIQYRLSNMTSLDQARIMKFRERAEVARKHARDELTKKDKSTFVADII